ncbi:hypothetical protein, partial [Mangrovicoccus algicola]
MSQETQITAALYEAAMASGDAAAADADAPSWPGFLARLADAAQAESALLRVDLPGLPGRLWQAGAPWQGPPAEVAERMRAGRVYSATDLPGGAADDAARPLRALRRVGGRGGQVILALARGGTDFRAVDGLLLSHLSPHLLPALEGWSALERARDRARQDRDLCRALGAGWVIFAPSGQILDMAPGLEDQLRGAAGIAIRADGRLALDPAAAQALHQGLAATARPGGAQGRDPAWVTLSQRPCLQMRLEPGTAA